MAINTFTGHLIFYEVFINRSGNVAFHRHTETQPGDKQHCGAGYSNGPTCRVSTGWRVTDPNKEIVTRQPIQTSLMFFHVFNLEKLHVN